MMFMQESTLDAEKLPPKQSPIQAAFRGKNGLLHPRWPILSAFVEILLGFLLGVIGYFVPCSHNGSFFLSFYCKVNAETFIMQCLLICGLFMLGWFCCFCFGYQFIEDSNVSRISQGNRPRDILKTISDFDKNCGLFYFLVAPLLVALLSSIFTQQIAALPFTLTIIVLFIAIWMYRYTPVRAKTKGQAGDMEPQL